MSQSEGRRLPDRLMHIVLAKQNELHELVMGTQPTIDGTPQLGAVDAKQPRLCAGSVLNVATTAGALHLLSYLRASATHSHREMIDEVDAQVRSQGRGGRVQLGGP